MLDEFAYTLERLANVLSTIGRVTSFLADLLQTSFALADVYVFWRGILERKENRNWGKPVLGPTVESLDKNDGSARRARYFSE